MAATVRDRHIEAVADAVRVDFPQARAVPEHLVPYHHEEVVLRQIQAVPLAKTLADAERTLDLRRFVEPRRRQPIDPRDRQRLARA